MESEKRLKAAEALEIWKHYADTGGKDKDRMVTIATGVFGFAVAIMSYLVTSNNALEERATMTFITVGGLVVSLIGIFVILLYAGYANWNWAKADKIARDHDLDALVPDACKLNDVHNDGLAGFLIKLVEPKDPRVGLAPLFWLFIAFGGVLILFYLYMIMKYNIGNILQFVAVM